MEDLHTSWDDLVGDDNTEQEPELDDDGNPIDPIDPIDPEGDDPEPGPPADPNQLEPLAGDDDDPEPGDPPADPDPSDPPADPEPNPNDPPVDMSGIEIYLSQFDIEGGMIAFDDGSSTHFNELDSTKQAEVLQQLHTSQATSVEEKYGLSETEVSTINYLRANNLSIEDMVTQMAAEQVDTILALKEADSTNYKEMEPDSVYLNFLKKSNPEATTEQLEQDLATAKTMSNYENVVGRLREQFETEQLAVVTQKKSAAKESQMKALEEQRRQVVTEVSKMKDIGGVSLDDNVKNSILDRVLEVDEDGDSKFMTEVFSEPDNLFKAAFWYYYGEDLGKQRDEYWKKEKSASYKRGRQDALGTGPTRKVSFSDNGKKPDEPAKPPKPGDDDWDSLHNS